MGHSPPPPVVKNGKCRKSAQSKICSSSRFSSGTIQGSTEINTSTTGANSAKSTKKYNRLLSISSPADLIQRRLLFLFEIPAHR